MIDRSFREHKPQPKRLGEEEDGGTGAEVSFIDLPPNNLTKPEKGILKKHGGYGIVIPGSCNTTSEHDIMTHDIS